MQASVRAAFGRDKLRQYGVVLVPKSPGLPTVADAIVTSAATTDVVLPAPTPGATVSRASASGPRSCPRDGSGPLGYGWQEAGWTR